MIKTALLILLLTQSLLSTGIILNYIPEKQLNTFQLTYEKAEHFKRFKGSLLFRHEFSLMIKKIKRQEGFRAIRYNDLGYDCIGYGQRTIFYPFVIPEKITEVEAEKILKHSFWRHIYLCKKVFPKSKGKDLIDKAYVSFTFGIKKLKKSK